MRLSAIMLPVAVLASACAKSPESIAPAYVSEVGYQSWDCATLAAEKARLANAYATAATQQEKARTNDTVGVILIGLPVSSLSGDNIAPEIARLKGEQQTIDRVMIQKAMCRDTAIRRADRPEDLTDLDRRQTGLRAAPEYPRPFPFPLPPLPPL